MDFSRNVVLKEHYTFFVADADAQARSGEHGLYNRDTRVLSRYAWRFLPAEAEGLQTLLAESPRPDHLHAHYALLGGDAQTLAVRRDLIAAADGLRDRLEIVNSSAERRAFSLELDVASDYVDVFEVRGWHQLDREGPSAEAQGTTLRFHYRAADALEQAVTLRFDPLAAARPDGADWELSLAPGERVEVWVEVAIDNPLDLAPDRKSVV